MNKVERGELLSLSAYEEIRTHFRNRMITRKERRRLTAGEHMSLSFENHDTVLLQVQEMLRTERISEERGIAHELETYNELVPGPGALCATLFIEYEDKAERTRMLGRFASLRQAVQLRIGERLSVARFGTHFGEEMDRLPAVSYLTFEVGTEHAAALSNLQVPAALELTHPDYRVVVPLPAALREELSADLRA